MPSLENFTEVVVHDAKHAYNEQIVKEKKGQRSNDTTITNQKLFLEDHFADDAVYGLEGKLKHLRERDEAQSVVGLTVGEDVRPQGLFLDLPVTTRHTRDQLLNFHQEKFFAYSSVALIG